MSWGAQAFSWLNAAVVQRVALRDLAEKLDRGAVGGPCVTEELVYRFNGSGSEGDFWEGGVSYPERGLQKTRQNLADSKKVGDVVSVFSRTQPRGGVSSKVGAIKKRGKRISGKGLKNLQHKSDQKDEVHEGKGRKKKKKKEKMSP